MRWLSVCLPAYAVSQSASAARSPRAVHTHTHARAHTHTHACRQQQPAAFSCLLAVLFVIVRGCARTRAGALYVEHEQWDKALQKLSRCRTVYDEMMHHAPTPAEKEMYQVCECLLPGLLWLFRSAVPPFYSGSNTPVFWFCILVLTPRLSLPHLTETRA